jgi:hypothetical protein
VSTPAITSPVESLLDRDLACASCGYNLRGLSSASRCPECAHPIPDSISAETKRLNPRHVRWLRWGLWLSLTSYVLWGATMGSYALWNARERMLFLELAFAGPIPWINGALLRSSPAYIGFPMLMVLRIGTSIAQAGALAGIWMITVRVALQLKSRMFCSAMLILVPLAQYVLIFEAFSPPNRWTLAMLPQIGLVVSLAILLWLAGKPLQARSAGWTWISLGVGALGLVAHVLVAVSYGVGQIGLPIAFASIGIAGALQAVIFVLLLVRLGRYNRASTS